MNLGSAASIWSARGHPRQPSRYAEQGDEGRTGREVEAQSRLRERPLATKKTAIKKTTTPAKAVAKKSETVKAPTRSKVPAEKMTKAQVIRFMAEQMEVPPKQVAGFFNLLIETATTQTRKLGEFTIPGLGKLVKAQRAARIGRNPATGETIKIKAKTTVKFRIAKSAKDAVVPPKP